MMPRKNAPSQSAAHSAAAAGERGAGNSSTLSAPPQTVSGKWLAKAMGIALAASAGCAWGALCLLFWQGGWQLLYHPEQAVIHTPASIGLAFQPVAIGATEAGEPRLRGWWIPADAAGRFSRYTALYLHSENGNLSHTLDALATLHATGVNVLAFDYRGYGQSQFARPSEARWREDAEWALNYLTGARHIAAKSIVLDGKELGANLALELAARHPELAGLVLESPSETAVDAIFNDARARLVPAHILVRDRFELDAPAAALRIPSLWFFKATEPLQPILYQKPTAFEKVTSAKMQVWFPRFPEAKKESIEAAALTHWLGDLQ